VGDINERARRLLEEQLAAARREEQLRREQELAKQNEQRTQAQHIQDVRALVAHLMRWVRRNSIPPSCRWQTQYGSKFWSGEPKYHHYTGWTIADVHWQEFNSAADGPSELWLPRQTLYVVTEAGNIGELHKTRRKPVPSGTDVDSTEFKKVVADDYQRITIAHVEDQIALLVNKHSTPWS
jgi:hypothetical protein